MGRKDRQTRILRPPLRVTLCDRRSGTVFLGPQGGQVRIHIGTGDLTERKVIFLALDDLIQDSRDDLLATAV